jgi:hypothetical protein
MRPFGIALLFAALPSLSHAAETPTPVAGLFAGLGVADEVQVRGQVAELVSPPASSFAD